MTVWNKVRGLAGSRQARGQQNTVQSPSTMPKYVPIIWLGDAGSIPLHAKRTQHNTV